jgi:hypothetical protein
LEHFPLLLLPGDSNQSDGGEVKKTTKRREICLLRRNRGRLPLLVVGPWVRFRTRACHLLACHPAQRSFILIVFPELIDRAGKSSLTVRFVEHHFVESYYPTIENTFSRIIKYNGQDFATEIVDTAGQVSIQA